MGFEFFGFRPCLRYPNTESIPEVLTLVTLRAPKYFVPSLIKALKENTPIRSKTQKPSLQSNVYASFVYFHPWG
mgnify:FL=1